MTQKVLVDWSTWELRPIDAILSHYDKPGNRAHLENEITRLRSGVVTGQTSIESIERIHKALMQIDNTLFSIQSAFDLLALSHADASSHSGLLGWHLDLITQFGLLIEQHALSIKPHVDRLPKPISTWFYSLASFELCPELQKRYTAIGIQYETDVPGSYVSLIQRPLIDPRLDACAKRMGDNLVAEKEAHFTIAHQEQSQAYFDRLTVASGSERLLLSDIRDFECSLFANLRFSLDGALRMLRDSFAQCHPECSREIDQLIASGRLRLLPTDDLPDLCLDTPFGSYVQVRFDGSLSSSVRLAHEMGHAVHQHLHRESEWAYVPLNTLDSETWALDFETAFLDYLITEHPGEASAVLAFKQSRVIEMNHRHRMLHHFERALHSTGTRSIDDIDTAWLTANRLFYGERIAFDAGFERSWTQVHHLFIAPFYLMIYGIAQERADANRPTLCINQLYPQRTE
jgi:hypothetical protein